MATVSLIDIRLLIGGYEVTSDHNQGSFQRTKDAPQATTFGANSHVYHPAGLKNSNISLSGYFDSDGSAAIDDVYAAMYGLTSDEVLTMVAPPGTEGSVAYSVDSVLADISPFGGSVGDMAAFSVSAQGSGDSFKGYLLADESAISSSSSGTPIQLTDLVAGETGRASLHVIAATGSPTLDVVVESDDAAGFASGTTRITFAQATGIGAQYLTTTTPTSDDYWRASWTFGGSGSITFVVNFGIA